jgi:hypothetical protein
MKPLGNRYHIAKFAEYGALITGVANLVADDPKLTTFLTAGIVYVVAGVHKNFAIAEGTGLEKKLT